MSNNRTVTGFVKKIISLRGETQAILAAFEEYKETFNSLSTEVLAKDVLIHAFVQTRSCLIPKFLETYPKIWPWLIERNFDHEPLHTVITRSTFLPLDLFGELFKKDMPGHKYLASLDTTQAKKFVSDLCRGLDMGTKVDLILQKISTQALLAIKANIGKCSGFQGSPLFLCNINDELSKRKDLELVIKEQKADEHKRMAPSSKKYEVIPPPKQAKLSNNKVSMPSLFYQPAPVAHGNINKEFEQQVSTFIVNRTPLTELNPIFADWINGKRIDINNEICEIEPSQVYNLMLYALELANMEMLDFIWKSNFIGHTTLCFIIGTNPTKFKRILTRYPNEVIALALWEQCTALRKLPREEIAFMYDYCQVNNFHYLELQLRAHLELQRPGIRPA